MARALYPHYCRQLCRSHLGLLTWCRLRIHCHCASRNLGRMRHCYSVARHQNSSTQGPRNRCRHSPNHRHQHR
eukprot:4165444-Pleurochrysis_carterae.AAC.1